MKIKKGFTLIELLITVALFTVVVTIAVGGFTNAIQTQRQVASLISAQSNVSLALEQMTRSIRTGYLFCNTVGNTQPVAAGNPNGADADCGCVLSAAPAPDGSWTCSALDFYDAEGDHTVYSLQDGTLTENTGSGALSITGDTVSVKYLQFELFGQTEADHWPPRITISLGVAPSSTDPAISNDVFNLETSVSARTIDCTPPSDGPVQC